MSPDFYEIYVQNQFYPQRNAITEKRRGKFFSSIMTVLIGLSKINYIIF